MFLRMQINVHLSFFVVRSGVVLQHTVFMLKYHGKFSCCFSVLANSLLKSSGHENFTDFFNVNICFFYVILTEIRIVFNWIVTNGTFSHLILKLGKDCRCSLFDQFLIFLLVITIVSLQRSSPACIHYIFQITT